MEFLVRLAPAATATPGAHRRGEVIAERPDGWRWGPGEAPPLFFVLAIPGVDAAKIAPFLERRLGPQFQELDPKSGALRDLPRRLLARRIRRLDWSNIPAALRSKASTVGRIVVGPGGDVTRTQILNFLLNEESGLTGSQEGLTLD